jgi:arylsulfatase A
VIFADDLGYGDLSCYGHPTIHTPHLDALAASGMKLTQFYVASPVCSPSRAALLTGCYPKRVGMHRHVIFPGYDYGLHTDEATIADVLRARGYATGAFGKWHLGHRPGLLPTDQGFDEFFGVPYSNDMAQFHRKPGNKYEFRYPMMRGTEVIEWEPDQHLLTKRLTEAAVGFIEAHAAEPFFVYLPHPMPHIPIYASADFEGRSPSSARSNASASATTRWSCSRATTARGCRSEPTVDRPGCSAAARARTGRAGSVSRASCPGLARFRPARCAGL